MDNRAAYTVHLSVLKHIDWDIWQRVFYILGILTHVLAPGLKHNKSVVKHHNTRKPGRK